MMLTLRGRGLVRKHLSKDEMPAFDQLWLEAFFEARCAACKRLEQSRDAYSGTFVHDAGKVEGHWHVL